MKLLNLAFKFYGEGNITFFKNLFNICSIFENFTISSGCFFFTIIFYFIIYWNFTFFFYLAFIIIMAYAHTNYISIWRYLLDSFEYVYVFYEDISIVSVESVMVSIGFNLLNQSFDLVFFNLWFLSSTLSGSELFWSFLLDDYIQFSLYNFPFFNDFCKIVNSFADNHLVFYDFPDYFYIYRSFIFEWFSIFSPQIRWILDFIGDNEYVLPAITYFFDGLSVFFLLFFFYCFLSSWYNDSSKEDTLVDQDYLAVSSTVESEEEIASLDDIILSFLFIVFLFFWYFYVNSLLVIFHTSELIMVLYILPLLYYLIMLVPIFLAFDFGVYFVSYLRGKGDSTFNFVELMYDYIAFASFYIRLVVQNVRLILMLFTFASFHEIIMIHEVDRNWLMSDENFFENSLNETGLSWMTVFYFFGTISVYIIYYFYELFHLLFVVIAQIIAFNAMVFWLFLFLYTMFSAEIHEKFFSYKRFFLKKISEKYLNFKNSDST